MEHSTEKVFSEVEQVRLSICRTMHVGRQLNQDRVSYDFSKTVWIFYFLKFQTPIW